MSAVEEGKKRAQDRWDSLSLVEQRLAQAIVDFVPTILKYTYVDTENAGPNGETIRLTDTEAMKDDGVVDPRPWMYEQPPLT